MISSFLVGYTQRPLLSLSLKFSLHAAIFSRVIPVGFYLNFQLQCHVVVFLLELLRDFFGDPITERKTVSCILELVFPYLPLNQAMSNLSKRTMSPCHFSLATSL